VCDRILTKLEGLLAKCPDLWLQKFHLVVNANELMPSLSSAARLHTMLSPSVVVQRGVCRMNPVIAPLLVRYLLNSWCRHDEALTVLREADKEMGSCIESWSSSMTLRPFSTANYLDAFELATSAGQNAELPKEAIRLLWTSLRWVFASEQSGPSIVFTGEELKRLLTACAKFPMPVDIVAAIVADHKKFLEVEKGQLALSETIQLAKCAEMVGKVDLSRQLLALTAA
jgi:hypothetical protein